MTRPHLPKSQSRIEGAAGGSELVIGPVNEIPCSPSEWDPQHPRPLQCAKTRNSASFPAAPCSPDYARRKVLISANVWLGSSSASQCPPGNDLPDTFVARSFQTESTSYFLPTKPLAPHRTRRGHEIFLSASASSCSRSIEAEAR